MREAVVVASSRTPLAKSYPRVVQPDPPGRPGRPLHQGRARQGAAARLAGDRGRHPRLRPAARVRRATTSPASRRSAPACRSSVAGHDGEPLLLVGAAGDRDGRPPDHPRAARTRRSAAASRASRMMKRDGDPNPWVKEHKPGIYMVMGDTAEVVAKRYKISREAQDEYSLLSQQRTARAQQEGFFKEELAPMQVTRGILDKKTGEIVGQGGRTTSRRTSATVPTRRSKGCCRCQPHFDKTSGQGHGHRRQLLAALRRRLRHAPDVDGPRQGARHQAQAHLPRLRGRRLRAGRDGHRPGLRGAEAAQAPRPARWTTSTCGS